MSCTKTSFVLSAQEAFSRLPRDGNPLRFVELLEAGAVSVEYYAPIGEDIQTPHDRDELYVVTAGSGTFVWAGQRREVKPGDLLFVPAHESHKFELFTPDFQTWVFFF